MEITKREYAKARGRGGWMLAALTGTLALIGCGGDEPSYVGTGGVLSSGGSPTAASGGAPGSTGGAPGGSATGGMGTAGGIPPRGGMPGGGSGGVTSSGGSPTSGSGGITGGGGSDEDGGVGGSGGSDTGTTGGSDTGGTGGTPTVGGGLPPTDDYGAPGPFNDVIMESNVGPGSNYTLYRPDASLGRDGFKHPIVTWGNGILTTPDQYQDLLKAVASHGFVIIGANDTQAERPALNTGMEWLIEQNGDASSPMMGKLDTSKEATLGYSWGGGAAIDTADRPNVKCTISMHGMPPRRTDAFTTMHAPLLLFTSTGDSFVTASGYVTPNYEKSTVQTFYATLDDSGAGHLYPVDTSAVSCVASIALGTCESARDEIAPTIAWLRLWVQGDKGAEKYFYGDDCLLCQSPFMNPQRKNWP